MTARGAALAVLAGCALDNPPFVEPQLGLDLDLDALQADLAPSAAIVSADRGDATRSSPGLRAWALADGGTAGFAWRGAAFEYGTYTFLPPGWYRTTPDGTVHTLDLTATSGVSLGDEVLVWDCPRVGLTDATAGFVLLEQIAAPDVSSPCGGTTGVGATPDRVLQLDPYQVAVQLHELDRAAGTDTVTVLGPAPSFPANAYVALVYEPAVGTVGYVLDVSGDVVFLDGAGSSVPATGLEGSDPQVWLGADGAIRIATSEGLFRADTGTGETTRLASVPDSPTGSPWVRGAWQGGAYAEDGPPNPGAPELLVPDAMAVRYATDDGFEVFEPPLTPCCDPDACRATGESYLLGGIGSGSRNVAVYDLWSWVGDDSSFTHVGIVRADLGACTP